MKMQKAWRRRYFLQRVPKLCSLATSGHLKVGRNSSHSADLLITPLLGLVNGSQGIVKKIWFNFGTNPRSHLPAVVFVKFDGYSGVLHTGKLGYQLTLW